MKNKLKLVLILLEEIEVHPGTNERKLDTAISLLAEIIKSDETLVK